MRKIVRLLSALSIAVQISGCSQKIVAPGTETLTNQECAYFKPDDNWFFANLSTTLSAVYPSTGRPVAEPRPFVEYSQIKVTPGTYGVLLRVESGRSIAFPALRVVAKPGKTYLFTARSVMDGAAVKAEYKEIDTIE